MTGILKHFTVWFWNYLNFSWFSPFALSVIKKTIHITAQKQKHVFSLKDKYSNKEIELFLKIKDFF